MSTRALLWLCTASALLLLLAGNQLRPVSVQPIDPRHGSPSHIPSPPPPRQLPPPPPQLQSPRSDMTSPTPASPLVHIVVAADAPLWPGVVGLIRSARTSSAAPDELRFHLITLPSQVAAAHEAMACFRFDRELVRVVSMPTEWLAGRIRVVADPAVTGSLSSPLNFARFYLPRLLPPLTRRVLYLDADVIVQSDLRLIAAAPLPSPFPVAAVPRSEAHFRYSRYAKRCDELYASRHGGNRLNTSAPTFNAGVALVDLRRWAALDLTAEAEWWLARHADSADGLWALGSQPVMHLILHGQWMPLSAVHLDGLGRMPHIPPAALRDAQLLHWTGRRKPWRADGLYTAHFLRHVGKAEVSRCARRTL